MNGTVLANCGVVKLDAGRQIEVFCGGLAGAVNFVVDITGTTSSDVLSD